MAPLLAVVALCASARAVLIAVALVARRNAVALVVAIFLALETGNVPALFAGTSSHLRLGMAPAALYAKVAMAVQEVLTQRDLLCSHARRLLLHTGLLVGTAGLGVLFSSALTVPVFAVRAAVAVDH
jgi:hypothetical protein